MAKQEYTYKVVRRDPVWHTRDADGNVIEHEVLDTGYEGTDLIVAAIDCDCKRLMAVAGHAGEWGIETDDPEFAGEDGAEKMRQAIIGTFEETDVYDRLTSHYELSHAQACHMLGGLWLDDCDCEDCQSRRN